jgi:Uma2 family endonuclease
MTAEQIGSGRRVTIPARFSRDEVHNLALADELHKYELSPEGVISVMVPPGGTHTFIVMQLILWFGKHGYGANQLAAENHALGVAGDGFRIPDIIVWPSDRTITDDWLSQGERVLLAVEVISPSTAVTDRISKKSEYADAGIPRYWIVERNSAHTVHRFVLNPERGEYEDEPAGPAPLAWLLSTKPDV